MASTVFTLEFHAGFKLHVELNDRPVDFEIEFPSGKKVKFSRTADAGAVRGTASIVPDPALESLSAPVLPMETNPSHQRHNVLIKEHGGPGFIRYTSDPRM